MTTSIVVVEQEPTELRAGDTWLWSRTDLDVFPAPDWTLKYRFKSPTLAGFEIVSITDGTFHTVNVTAATTATYAAGTYSWQAWVEGGTSEVYTVAEGELVVRPNFRAGTAAAVLDDRSTARKMVEGLEAAELTFAETNGRVTSYQIADRHMTFQTSSEVKSALSYWRTRLANEVAEDNLSSGRQGGRRLFARL